MKKSFYLIIFIIIFSVLSPEIIQAKPHFILIHVIQKGDTLYDLARDYNTSVKEILKVNDLSENERIKLGDELVIPGTESEKDNKKPHWNQSLFDDKNNNENYDIRCDGNYAVRINPDQSLPEVNIPESKIIKYHVGVGDTLYDLANSFNTTTGVIMALNNMENSMIRIGEILRLPINNLNPRQVISKTTNNNDINLLARAIHGEARGEPFIGQVAVGAVIINRVLSSYFPDSFKNVIYQEGQFCTVDDGQINLTPNRTAYEAAREALNGTDPTMGSLYFYNPRTARDTEWTSSRKSKVTIGDHIFAK